MILSSIAAMSRNRVIGRDNQLPWHVPEDLQFFREKTKGKILILGRKTFESLGGKPLPGRLHIVITRQKDWNFEHPMVRKVMDVESALKLAQQELQTGQWPDEVYVVGGSEIYKQTMPLLNKLYLTVMNFETEGDAYFPEFEQLGFKLAHEVPGQQCRFLTYVK